jgi:hypothetical protein
MTTARFSTSPGNDARCLSCVCGRAATDSTAEIIAAIHAIREVFIWLLIP